ncbi:MAG: iron ABC transporter permease [Dactylosporangium sp.]|nr:iron ABC transporter permease [Dactylosporangium sp.]NNJ62028.1 iron ABC transporter permease [Dactylosporangium sp.]
MGTAKLVADPAGERAKTDPYRKFTGRKKAILAALVLLVFLMAIVALHAGAMNLDPRQVLRSILGDGGQVSGVVIWRIRLPRILAAIVAGAGLSVAGCVIQNNLRNPLAAPSTLGISSAAAFGANLAIIVFGAGAVQVSNTETITINSPYLVTVCAFASAMLAAVVILLLARIRGFSPEAMVLAGVALNSLFHAGTILVQYSAEDLQIAAVVFWTFGDLGRVSWREVAILAGLTAMALGYFTFRRWDYNALDSGEETAKSLGVHVERIRQQGMLVACLITAVAVSFLGIIGFIGLVGPQIIRRVIGGDHRYLIPASALTGSLLLLVSDTLARTMVSPVVLPVGAITSFFGAPLFLYLLVRGYRRS